MDERSALLRAILENPADDTVRLAFADWLEEHDEADWAELIREQCDLHGVPVWRHHDMPRATWERRAERLTDLCARHGREWVGFDWYAANGLVEFRDLPSPCAMFVRGFVREVRLPASAFTEAVARELFSRHPVTAVILTDVVVAVLGLSRFMTAFRDSSDTVYVVPHPGVPQQTYTTADECRTDLARSLVNWGRTRAGLPPLPPDAVTLERPAPTLSPP